MPAATATPVSRFSVSLPPELLERLDDMVQRRELASRSAAIAEMIRQELVEQEAELGTRVVAGTISLMYANDRNALRHQIALIQRQYIKEVISSQHVFLEHDHSLEVLLVQGPARRLQRLADELRSCRGVHQVKLFVTAAVLPPLH